MFIGMVWSMEEDQSRLRLVPIQTGRLYASLTYGNLTTVIICVPKSADSEDSLSIGTGSTLYGHHFRLHVWRAVIPGDQQFIQFVCGLKQRLLRRKERKAAKGGGERYLPLSRVQVPFPSHLSLPTSMTQHGWYPFTLLNISSIPGIPQHGHSVHHLRRYYLPQYQHHCQHYPKGMVNDSLFTRNRDAI